MSMIRCQGSGRIAGKEDWNQRTTPCPVCGETVPFTYDPKAEGRAAYPLVQEHLWDPMKNARWDGYAPKELNA